MNPERSEAIKRQIEDGTYETPERIDGTVVAIEDELAAIAAEVPQSEWDKLPTDLTENLDHYLYGKPIVAVPPSAVLSAAVIAFSFVFVLLCVLTANLGGVIWGMVR